ncbi:gamma-glutamyltransferase family protein [Sphingomonas sp. BIUV-7]|uniref:Gamma-glutamyltransferase family protein n=1 Tax=Sphingomonas natans TaxID=3063330 RepID=A0ABT8Y7S3_9SPHN|nr:gamma-glutamyltransferase family protein [Sphingomonas sp. BIUV-7]MDO6413953.1 gamma-glutamyltransferase family protein [Sphingomonas sp. BIUV-7]
MLETPRSDRGMVTSPHHLASQAGLDILKEGGTAIEAAVAMAACLAVVYPHMTGIGGDGFWLIAEPDGRVRGIDACGRAARAADPSLYAGHAAIPTRGALAANTVAGTVSGWEAALVMAPGTLPPARLLRDAIHYAEAGAPVTRSFTETLAAKRAELAGLPGFGEAYAVEGGRLRQPRLAETLRRIAGEGLDAFYRGELAADIAADLADIGSPVTAADIAAHRASEVTPLSVEAFGATLYNLPPPTQGLASLLILGALDRLGTLGPQDGFTHIHLLVEAVKQAFLIRDTHVGDPAGMTLDPQALLDDQAALEAMAKRVDRARALPWPQPPSAGDTTWFGAIDREGRVVSVIQSIFFEFGSGMVLPRTGIVWQNRGSSFRLAEGGWNPLKPGAKPFHTLNPALARFRDGRVMAYGTMGGEGQPQTQAQIFARHVIYGEPLQQAVTAPRFLLGRTWGEPSVTLKLEDRFPPETVAALVQAGHDIEMLPAFTPTMGHAGALVRHVDGLLEGASDPRSDGAVAAW